MIFAEVLDALGYTDNEHVSVLYWVPDDERPRAAIGLPSRAPSYADRLPDTANAFFGVNAVRGPARRGERGKECDVTRLAALVCDLDIAADKCPTRDVALAIIREIGIILDSLPSIVVDSGHGLHGYWVISDGHIVGGDIASARALVKRFGRLVTLVADRWNAAADSVYDLARVLRLPGSHNNKHLGGEPSIPVTAQFGGGGPLTMAEVDERLTEVGVHERADDRAVTGAEISPPADWKFAKQTCPYVARMVACWPTDRPKAGAGRNPYVYNRFIRLFAARRLGCITETDYRQARQVLTDLLAELVSTIEPRRAVKRFEIADMTKHGIAKVAAKTDAQTHFELGRHYHLAPVGCWTPQTEATR